MLQKSASERPIATFEENASIRVPPHIPGNVVIVYRDGKAEAAAAVKLLIFDIRLNNAE